MLVYVFLLSVPDLEPEASTLKEAAQGFHRDGVSLRSLESTPKVLSILDRLLEIQYSIVFHSCSWFSLGFFHQISMENQQFSWTFIGFSSIFLTFNHLKDDVLQHRRASRARTLYQRLLCVSVGATCAGCVFLHSKLVSKRLQGLVMHVTVSLYMCIYTCYI